VRVPNGRFRVIAGNGVIGYSGDGGSAIDAELSNVSDLAFAPDGSLYIADGSRVRVVNLEGIIRTIAGSGRPGTSVANGTPALSASLTPVNSLAIALSPSGQLYISTDDQLLRLSAGRLDTIRAVDPSGLLKGPVYNIEQIAVDGYGNIDVSGFNGWSIWQVAPNGDAAEVGLVSEARRSGGAPSVLERSPDGAVYGEGGSTLLRVQGHELVPEYGLGNRLINGEYFWLTFFAFGAHGVIYADETPGGGGFERHQQLLSVRNGHPSVLWQESNKAAN
jgi:hypothetical protein